MSGRAERPFSIRIFLPDGSSDGLRIVEKSNWAGVGLVCPRAIFPRARARPELASAGVYVLVGPPDDADLPTVYVGEADQMRLRLENHYLNKDFWTWFVAFVSKDGSLNKAHAQYLEARLVKLASEAGLANLQNGNMPNRPHLSEADVADADSFIADMLSIFPVLGLNVFERPRAAESAESMLTIRGRGVQAKGYESAQGFVVVAGSQAAASEVDSIHRYLSVLRKELLEKGVLAPAGQHLEFRQDYPFNSPSTAAGIVLGRTCNGRVEWKDAQQHTLKQIQEAATASTPG
jgi:hypothetical protein